MTRSSTGSCSTIRRIAASSAWSATSTGSTPASRRSTSANCQASGFRWLVGDDRANSVFAYLRCGAEDSAPVLVVCNMTPVPRHGYRIGVPRAGRWREIANTNSRFYGGSDLGNDGAVHALEQPSHGEAHSVLLTLPPLSTVMLRAEG